MDDKRVHHILEVIGNIFSRPVSRRPNYDAVVRLLGYTHN